MHHHRTGGGLARDTLAGLLNARGLHLIASLLQGLRRGLYVVGLLLALVLSQRRCPDQIPTQTAVPVHEIFSGAVPHWVVRELLAMYIKTNTL